MESILLQAAKLWNPNADFSSNTLAEFVNKEEPATEAILDFVEEMQDKYVNQWLLTFKDFQYWNENPPAADTPDSASDAPCADGQCVVKISSDALTAWMMVLPAIGNGIPVSPAQAAEALERAGVCSGVISEAYLSACLECFRAFTVAKGTAPVNGTDGSVEELYPREVTPSFRVTDNDTVDYRDLGWLQTVKTGDVICNVVQATPGSVGETVTGKTIPAKNGVMPRVPMGKNLKYTADKTKIVAQCEGRLVFSSEAFSVETCLVISGDVDGNVGNIAMPGDVVIKGNVLSGFTVFAKGSLSVSGVVENAYLSAQGDITISIGVKSDGSAVIESNKNINCKFVENGTLRAKGSITAEYIVNSTISALRDINITRGKGTLIGGNVRVGRKISAKTIGNSTNRPITISMGMDPEVLQELQHNQKEMEQLEAKIAEASKNIAFLEEQDTLDAQYKKLHQQLKFQKSIDSMHVAKLQKAIEKAKESFDPEACEIETETFYPPATIHIGSSTYHSNNTWNFHKVVFREGDISVIPR